jgi:hypothetical protein
MPADDKKPLGLMVLGGGPSPKASKPPMSGSSMSTAPDEDMDPGDEGPESMASQGVMDAMESKDPVAFKDALSTLLESMGYSKTAP